MARSVSSPVVAETVLRLAVLLQAGVSPGRAWAYLAEAGNADASRVCSATAKGMPLPSAIASAAPPPVAARWPRRSAATGDADGAWRDVSAAWQVATAVGAPLAESLRALALALRDAQEAADGSGWRSPSPRAPPG